MSQQGSLFVLTALLVLIGGALHYAGLRINYSDSLPGLFWKLEPLSEVEQLQAGDVVFVCPPDNALFRAARQRGYWAYSFACSGGHPPLIKPIAAVAGDRVSVTADGVSVNGQLIPASAPYAHDRSGRALPDLTGRDKTLSDGQLWLLATYHPYSFDSRYFGAVELKQVQGTARPLALPAFQFFQKSSQLIEDVAHRSREMIAKSVKPIGQ